MFLIEDFYSCEGNSSANKHASQLGSQLAGKDTRWNMRTAPPRDGRELHTLHLHSWSDPQTVDAVLSPVIKHLNVVSCFMMCAVGPGICVWTVQARGFNCSLPLKRIQYHLDPLSAGTGSLSLSLTHSLLLLCLVEFIFLTSLNYPVSLSIWSGGDVYEGVAGVSVIWKEYLESTLLGGYIALAAFTTFTPKQIWLLLDYVRKINSLKGLSWQWK